MWVPCYTPHARLPAIAIVNYISLISWMPRCISSVVIHFGMVRAGGRGARGAGGEILAGGEVVFFSSSVSTSLSSLLFLFIQFLLPLSRISSSSFCLLHFSVFSSSLSLFPLSFSPLFSFFSPLPYPPSPNHYLLLLLLSSKQSCNTC